MAEPTLRQRYRGSLLGLAVGDALGVTLEFIPPGQFDPISDMIGGGPFGLKPGQWTDDTSMALCLAESLVECGGFNPKDQMQRYVRWWQEGYLSSTGHCFDIGNTVRKALEQFLQTGEPYSGSTSPATAGNGSLMRLAPIPLAFLADSEQAIAYAADSSRTTHQAREAVDACRYFAGLIIGALQGRDKAEILSAGFCPVEGLWNRAPLSEKIGEIASGSFKEKDPPAIRGRGYVVDCLEAALWAFYKADNFRDGALLAVNLGEDSDTTGAVFGQIAGAYWGENGIPEQWQWRLIRGYFVGEVAEKLLDLSGEK